MVVSLRIKRSLRRFQTFLIAAAAALTVVACALGAFSEGRPWLSAAIGWVAGLIMFAVSWLTTSRTAQSEVPHIGWIALDYVVKVAITAGVLVWAKNADHLHVATVGFLMIAAIILNMLAQAAAFYQSSSSAGRSADQT